MRSDNEHADSWVVLARTPVTVERLAELRALTVRLARDAGLDSKRAEGFALAVNEAATNTIRYATGSGQLTLIKDDARRLLAEVTDEGPGLAPGVRSDVAPPPDAVSGRGLWLSQQMCDRMDVRTGSTGTVVRLEMLL